MALTLGLTGMDPATEAALKAAFADANARLGGRWALQPEADAEHIVVDMDSMYGPMSWLRLHAAGKHVIGLTSAPRTQTDFRLGRPFDHEQVEALLREVAAGEGVALVAGAATPAPPTAAVAPPLPDAPAPASPDVAVPARGVTKPDATPATPEPAAPVEAQAPPPVAAEDIALSASVEALDAATAQAARDGVSARPAPAQAAAATAATSKPETPATPAAIERAADAAGVTPVAALTPGASPVPAETPPDAPREKTFADYLVPGALATRVRFSRAGGPALLIDPQARVYHGPALLKPAAAYFDGAVDRDDFETLPDAAWTAAAAAEGEAQPLARLAWYGGLLAGGGALLPGFDAEGRFRLNKWPQTEREYPRHFRIATAMMKGPATLPAIAEASGLSLADVTDFVNANLATGFAEAVPEAPSEPTEPPKPTGLFGRLRGRG